MPRLHLFSLALVLALLAGCDGAGVEGGHSPSSATPTAAVKTHAIADSRIERAYAERQSDLQVETAGRVDRLLSDDLQGSRHQRFIIRLDSGLTLLVAHNIDLAPRIEGLAPGDRVELYGEYEWNDKGGVIHWTHRDPRGEHPHGWIRHRQRLYD